MNSRGPSKIVHINRNFTYIASCISVIMRGDFKVVHISRFNSVHINEVPLYTTEIAAVSSPAVCNDLVVVLL